MIDTLIQFLKDVLSNTDGNQFLSGGLILGAITGVLLGLRKAAIWIWGRIERAFTYVMYIDNSTPLYNAFSLWYLEHYPDKFRSTETYFRDNTTDVGMRQFNDFNFIWYNHRPIFILKYKEFLEQAKEIVNSTREKYFIYGLFGKKAILKIVEEAAQYYRDIESSKEGIRVIHGARDTYEEDSTQYITDHKTLAHIFSVEKDLVVEDINKFLRQREIYLQKGIKLKRSYLLSGPGGTGKTTLVFGIADWLNRPIYYVNPSKFYDDYSFEKFIHKVTKNSILLIEDIDTFFTSRDEKNEDTKVSFQCLLNVLDGANSPSDVLIFITTNHPEKLDQALVRKGRVDYHAEMNYPEPDQVSLFMSDFYDTKVIVGYDPHCPMSEIQDICLRHNTYLEALEELEWKQNHVAA